jgi:hypothetical protein
MRPGLRDLWRQARVKEINTMERVRFGVTLLTGAGIVLVLASIAVLLVQHSHRSAANAVQHLPFGPEEQTYAPRIHILDLRMARASNFLDQEITYVAGTLANDGVSTIRDAELTVEFHDSSGHVVLRESRNVVGSRGSAITGGQRRDFQFSLESVPNTWNQQYPAVRITGLALEQ